MPLEDATEVLAPLPCCWCGERYPVNYWGETFDHWGQASCVACTARMARPWEWGRWGVNLEGLSQN